MKDRSGGNLIAGLGAKKKRRMRLFCLGAAVFFSYAAFGEQGPRIVGPGGGGAMFHVTINPHDRNEVLLSCDMTGAYISHDGGRHWRMFSLRGSVHFFAFDPLQRHTLYAGTEALWKSTDDGESWHLLWPRPSTVRAVVMDSDHADESYLSTPNPIGTITDLAIDPADSRTLYVTAIREGRSSIVLSRDGGQRWRSLLPLEEAPLHLWIDPRSARGQRDVYVATSAGIRARIRGQWQQRDLPSGFTLAEVSAGFSAKKDREVVFYAVATDKQSRRQLFLTTDGGVTWAPARLPGSGTQVRAVATSLNHPETAYASYKDLEIDGKRLQGVARTDDYGAHWRLVWRSSFQREDANVHDAWIAEAMTPEWTEEPLSLTVDDHDPNVAYATDLGRTMETTDGGANWVVSYSESAKEAAQSEASWISTGLDVTTTYGYDFDPFDPRRRFILTTDIGLFRSEDGGQSWMRSVEGAPARWRNTTYSVAFDPKVRGKMWAAMSEIHDLPRPKMWRHRPTSEYIGGICISVDGGKTWQAASKGMPETAPTSVVLDPTSPAGKRTLWAATMGYGVFRSTDDGHTWSPINRGITQENPLAWRLVRASDGTLYTLIARRSEDGSIGNSGDGALYRSTDGGENWIPVPLPTGANAPNGLAIDPEDPNHLYLALWARAMPEGEPIASPNEKPSQMSIAQRPVVLDGVSGGIAVSTDGGRTWRWVLERDRHIYDVTIDPRDPRTLYASGFESSAWISHDKGEHWSRIPGFNFKWGHRVEADPEDSSKVYISTFGGGVWHIPTSGSSPKDIATPALAPAHSR
jgi:photosystem II stability/assembly factor-like uncharacterized protein